MKNISLKKLMLALIMGVAVPCVNAQTSQVAHIGDILCEDNQVVSPANFNASSHTPIGVVFYVDNVGKHGWAIDLQDMGSYIWQSAWNDTPLTNYGSQRLAIYDLDGYRNTEIIYAQYNDSTFSARFPAFDAVDFENGWYLPTLGQLNYLYGNLIEVNAGIYAAGGTPFETGINWAYWSSTEYSTQYTWVLLSNGGFNYDSMPASRRVRAARNFSLDQ